MILLYNSPLSYLKVTKGRNALGRRSEVEVAEIRTSGQWPSAQGAETIVASAIWAEATIVSRC